MVCKKKRFVETVDKVKKIKLVQKDYLRLQIVVTNLHLCEVLCSSSSVVCVGAVVCVHMRVGD